MLSYHQADLKVLAKALFSEANGKPVNMLIYYQSYFFYLLDVLAFVFFSPVVTLHRATVVNPSHYSPSLFHSNLITLQAKFKLHLQTMMSFANELLTRCRVCHTHKHTLAFVSDRNLRSMVLICLRHSLACFFTQIYSTMVLISLQVSNVALIVLWCAVFVCLSY